MHWPKCKAFVVCRQTYPWTNGRSELELQLRCSINTNLWPLGIIEVSELLAQTLSAPSHVGVNATDTLYNDILLSIRHKRLQPCLS